jgi:hypothetical protein
VRHDQNAEIYINGRLAAKLLDRRMAYERIPLSRQSRISLKTGQLYDIFWPDGRPYDPGEIELVRDFTFLDMDMESKKGGALERE